jgi:ribosomal protein L37AE/L43A
MDEFRDYFLCDHCQNKDFTLVYNFSLRFHGVNFSNNLIYDRMSEEIYKCTKCEKKFTRGEIEDGLNAVKKSRKER